MLDRALTVFARGATHGVILGGIAAFIGVSPYALWAGVFTWIIVNALLDAALPEEPRKTNS